MSNMKQMFDYDISSHEGGEEVNVKISVYTDGDLKDAVEAFGMILVEDVRQDFAERILEALAVKDDEEEV